MPTSPKHTPGPWKAKRHGNDPGNYWQGVSNAAGVNVCTFHMTPQRNKHEQESDANAYLIAVAAGLIAWSGLCFLAGQAYAYFSLIRCEEQKIKLFQGTGKGDEK